MINIKEKIADSIAVKQRLLANETLLSEIYKVSEIITQALANDKKVLFCGNGGSAADAQHLAAELSGRFYFDRDPLFAEALHVNTSYITAVANDYSYDEIYARLVKGKGREGDVLIAISTSGNSENLIKALSQAKKQSMLTVGFTGESGGKMKAECDFLLNVDSIDTPRIQECHILIGHLICEIVESNLFAKK